MLLASWLGLCSFPSGARFISVRARERERREAGGGAKDAAAGPKAKRSATLSLGAQKAKVSDDLSALFRFFFRTAHATSKHSNQQE